MVTLLRDHVAVTGKMPFEAGGTATACPPLAGAAAVSASSAPTGPRNVATGGATPFLASRNPWKMS